MRLVGRGSILGVALAMAVAVPPPLGAAPSGAPVSRPLRIVPCTGAGREAENPVDAALAWLVEHQLDDGSWSFDLDDCPNCSGKCSHSGAIDDRPAATALALLPFLGRGYTHRAGRYTKQVERGIAFLAARAERQHGVVYDTASRQPLEVQGLAVIALAECRRDTEDDSLVRPAQLALDHIVELQDHRTGGWGHRPGDDGHTAAVGLQIMALRSGVLAGLEVDRQAFAEAGRFLDFVQTGSGAAYGDTDATNPGSTSSSAGLLCRLLLGWRPDNPALHEGVLRLAKVGPGKDLLGDYYATQVMHHVEGDVWRDWFDTVKPLLMKTQAKEGHEAGSWHEGLGGDDPLFVGGGRLQTTALATMIYEVYYGWLSLYRDSSCPAKADKK